MITNEAKPEEKIKDEKLKKYLTKGMTRMLNFDELKQNQNQCIAILSNQGKLNLNVSIYVEE